jgi:hypothetical protein
MKLSEIIAAARQFWAREDLERFLDGVCGSDKVLRDEVMRQLAVGLDPVPPQITADHHAEIQGDIDPSIMPAVAEMFLPILDVDVRVGDLLDNRYRIREEVGHGGMGVVFAADQTTPVERRVAVKVIKAGMDSAAVLARFGLERQILALMDHPNIARIYDGGVTGRGRPYFVMELVRGLSLSAYCDQERLTVRQRIELFVPICRAVQHAHQKGIIHRDLKPSNILVTLIDGKPTAKVIDFGIAKALHAVPAHQLVYTAHNVMLGTLEYMAPEQASPTGLDIDTRADVYSLGVVLYELLCGILPLAREEHLHGSIDEMARQIREIEPKRPSTRVSTIADSNAVASRRKVDATHLRKTLKGELDWVVMKCLEKERDRRYETALGLAADLERYLRREPVLAAPPSTAYRTKKFVQRHAGKVAVACLCLVLLVAGTIAATIGWVRAARAERLAQDEAAIHRALTRFIQNDMLDTINPSERIKAGLPPDSNVALKTVINRVSQQLDKGRLADQPLVEASLRLTLAKAFFSLGEYAVALDNCQRAEQTFAAHRGSGHTDRIDALELLGRILLASDEVAKAEAVLQEALQWRRRLSGESDPRTFRLRYSLAIIERRRGNTAAAATSLAALLKDEEQALGAANEETLICQRALGETLLSLNRLDEAKATLLDARSKWETEYGESYPETLGTLNSLGVVLSRKNELQESEEVIRELLNRAAKSYEPQHPLIAVYKVNLAALYLRMGKNRQALVLSRESCPILEQKAGVSHARTLEAKAIMARALAEEEFDDEAGALYESLPSQFIGTFGPAHRTTWSLVSTAARFHANRDNGKKAIEILALLLRKQRDQKPPNAKAIADTMEQIVPLLRQIEGHASAKKLASEVIAELPPDSDERKRIEGHLVELRRAK